jgi:hypothetical protein
MDTMKVLVTKEAHQLVQSKAIYPFDDSKCELTVKGVWVELQVDTFHKIGELSHVGETFSDTVIRLLSPRQ